MATDFPTSIDNFGFTAAAGKAVPFDTYQRAMDAIVAIETLLGAGSAASTSFTPTIVSSGGGTPTYTTQVGRYRRFLGLVHVTGRITLATLGTLATGTITIEGLPVASVNTSGLYSAIAFGSWQNLTTNVVNINGFIAPNTSVIQVNIVTVAAQGVTAMAKADLAGTSDFVFSGLYPAT